VNCSLRKACAGKAPRLTLLTLALLILAQPVQAADDHEEFELREDARLTLSTLLDATIERHPEAGVLAAGRGMASAEAAFGDRLLAATSPSRSGATAAGAP